MAEKFRSLMKAIVGEITKHRLFNNATATINNATGRAQEKLNNMQNIVASKYDVIAKQVNHDITVMQNLSSAQLEPSPLPRRVVKWMHWYQQLTGLDTVEIAKQQVILAQDKLFNCQDGRRQLNRQVTIINDKLKEVYSELIQTKRDDPKYVQLTIVENKGLQEQARIMSQLNLLDKEEKDHFTQLATAIKEYHDSQTLNAQKFKYLSILASAGLAIISLIGSMIYNNKRIVSVRNVITKAQEKNETAFRDRFSSLESNVNTRMSQILTKLDNNNKQGITAIVNEDLDTYSSVLAHVHLVLGVTVILLVWKAFIG